MLEINRPQSLESAILKFCAACRSAVKRRAKSTPLWARTAPARARWHRSIAGHERLCRHFDGERHVTKGSSLLGLEPRGYVLAKAFFSAFNIPVEIAGVNNAYLLKAAAQCKTASTRVSVKLMHSSS